MANVQNIVLEGIVDGVKKAVYSESTAAQPRDTKEIVEAVESKVAPIVAHVTNSEPWYQSRVTLGAILAAAAGVLGLFGYAFPSEVQGKVIDLIIALAPIIGGGFALYGRWAAKKPLGS